MVVENEDISLYKFSVTYRSSPKTKDGGKLIHNEKGPAIVHPDGSEEWYINGEKINCHSQEEFEKLLKMKAFW